MLGVRARCRFALLSVLGGCGPQAPGDGATRSTGEPETSAATDLGGPGVTSGSTGPDAPATTDVPAATTDATTDAAASTTSATGGTTATTDATDSGDTTAGLCEVDPALGFCPETCDWWTDCCQCNGRTFALDPAAPGCELRMGIVTDRCLWDIDWVTADGEPLDEHDGGCDGAAPGWTQHLSDGDVVVELCGETCEAYLAGEVREVKASPFCEAA